MKSVFIAYLLWLFGCFGVLGLQRFYIGKFGTGLLWLFTFGLAGYGAFMDFFTLAGQVEAYNDRAVLRGLGSFFGGSEE
ncbi:TM2 domain-containing protein [Leptospira kmetyi]|uniref:TM2 domain-containing protein n=1 Tax=Leptospira kmetyi TaxID=408139 RepID=UPI001083935E|nr:NINE protein [Leptospira kmetyi]